MVVGGNISANVGAFCCAGILCSVSRQLKPIEKLMMKLCNVAGNYSVSRIWADSDKKMRIYSSASIAENLTVVCSFLSPQCYLMFFICSVVPFKSTNTVSSAVVFVIVVVKTVRSLKKLSSVSFIAE